MNIILLEKDELRQERVWLSDRRARHIVKVLRSQPGDTVKVGIVNGNMGTGTIKEIRFKQPYSVVLDLVLQDPPLPKPSFDFVLALPRPIMLKRILSQLASLGMGHLYVINANRVEKSFWDATLISSGTWKEHILEGLEQAVDTRIPDVSFHRGFRPFAEEVLPSLKSDYDQMLLAHPGPYPPLSGIMRSGGGRLLIAVGPEGGWVEFEVERFKAGGFSQFSLGPRILKVETAITVIHGMVSALNQPASARP